MKWLINLWRSMTICYISPTFIHNSELLCINDDKDNNNHLHTYFGITDERCKELINIINNIEDECFIKTGNYHNGDILVEISKHCKHPNELALCVFTVGFNTGKSSPIIIQSIKK